MKEVPSALLFLLIAIFSFDCKKFQLIRCGIDKKQ